MKKLFSIFMVLFLISSVSFAAGAETCGEWATYAADAETDVYGWTSMNDWWSIHRYYLNACDEAGGSGNMLDPVFL